MIFVQKNVLSKKDYDRVVPKYETRSRFMSMIKQFFLMIWLNFWSRIIFDFRDCSYLARYIDCPMYFTFFAFDFLVIAIKRDLQRSFDMSYISIICPVILTIPNSPKADSASMTIPFASAVLFQFILVIADFTSDQIS